MSATAPREPDPGGTIGELCAELLSLAPCPFCGGPGWITTGDPEEPPPYWNVECGGTATAGQENCGALGPDDKTRAGAIDKWNRRVRVAE